MHARQAQRLIVGAWAHLLLYNVLNTQRTGDTDFDLTALIDLRHTLLRWFDHRLKDIDTGIIEGRPVTVFTMGENRWQALEDWPPPQVRYGRYDLPSGGPGQLRPRRRHPLHGTSR